MNDQARDQNRQQRFGWLRLMAYLGDGSQHHLLGLIDQAVVSGGRFLTTVLVGRICGVDQLGVYSLGFTLIVLAASFQECLVSAPYNVFSHRTLRGGRRRLAGAALVQALGFAAVAGLMLAVAAALTWSTLTDLSAVLATLSLLIPFLLLREFVRRMAFTHLRPGWALLVDASATGLALAGLGGLAWSGQLSPWSAHAAVGVSSLLVVCGWLALRGRTRMRLQRERLAGETQRNWVFGRWLLAGHLVVVLQWYAMHWLLAFTVDTAATGGFQACMTIVFLANPLLLGIGNILEPRAARVCAEQGAEAVGRVVTRAAVTLGLLMFAFAMVLTITAPLVLGFAFGEQYVRYAPTAGVLAFALWAGSFGLAADAGLRALEQSAISFRSNVAGVIATLLVSGGLLAPWGVFGAACGLLAGTATVSIWRMAAFLRQIHAPAALKEVVSGGPVR